jgi:hypothetical protein
MHHYACEIVSSGRDAITIIEVECVARGGKTHRTVKAIVMSGKAKRLGFGMSHPI